MEKFKPFETQINAQNCREGKIKPVAINPRLDYIHDQSGYIEFKPRAFMWLPANDLKGVIIIFQEPLKGSLPSNLEVREFEVPEKEFMDEMMYVDLLGTSVPTKCCESNAVVEFKGNYESDGNFYSVVHKVAAEKLKEIILRCIPLILTPEEMDVTAGWEVPRKFKGQLVSFMESRPQQWALWEVNQKKDAVYVQHLTKFNRFPQSPYDEMSLYSDWEDQDLYDREYLLAKMFEVLDACKNGLLAIEYGEKTRQVLGIE